MTISPKVKTFLVITAKHLVLAAFTNAAFMVAFPKEFHLHDWRGAGHVLLMGIAQIVGRESVQVWLPAILAWAKT
jgi:hypothetical protein